MYLGFIYFVAFFCATKQLVPLVGSNGLYPVSNYLSNLQSHYGKEGMSPCYSCTNHVSSKAWSINVLLVWSQWCSAASCVLVSKNNTLWSSNIICRAGVALSLCVMVLGMGSSVIMFVLWALYMSISNIGQLFYGTYTSSKLQYAVCACNWLCIIGYGWEMQLLETGFLAIFLVKAFPSVNLPGKEQFRDPPPSRPILWLYRWLIFRIMIGAVSIGCAVCYWERPWTYSYTNFDQGLIKIRGDSCWRDLTCLDYHYETQPIPNPISWYARCFPAAYLHIKERPLYAWFFLRAFFSNSCFPLVANLFTGICITCPMNSRLLVYWPITLYVQESALTLAASGDYVSYVGILYKPTHQERRALVFSSAHEG